MKRINTLTKLLRNRRGAILVLSAALMVAMLGFVALTVDVGIMMLTRTQLQVAADASALAAAPEVGRHSSSNGNLETAVKAVSSEIASKHTAMGAAVQLLSTDTVLGIWDSKTATFTPLSGASIANANAVQVTCARNADHSNPVQFFFAPILGVKTGNVSASAIARIKSSRCGLIIGINSVTMSGSSYTDSFESANGGYSKGSGGAQGHVCSNGDIVMSGSTDINGDAHPGVGHIVKNSGSSSVSGDKKPLSQSLSYPSVDPGNAATVNNNSSIPKTDKGKVPLDSNGKFSMSGGDGVTLPPGTYYFSEIALSGNSAMRIIGPTIIYVTTKVAMSGSSMSNSTYLPKNLQLNVMGTSCDISGSADFYGVVYAPNAKVVRSGSSDYYGSVIGKDLDLSGSGGIHSDLSLDSSATQQGAITSTLVQ